MTTTIYKTPNCPRCRELAAYLTQLGVDFDEQDMNQKSDVSDPASCSSEVSAIEIDEVQRGWSLRGRGLDMVFGDESYMRARVAPLAARLGVEPGLLLISPALARWP